ncbi:MAG: PAS-domain containing protein [Rhodospirillales bacterium]|nr:MAG: PAS-domain containing protein [Rhodospirillales bacterium]
MQQDRTGPLSAASMDLGREPPESTPGEHSALAAQPSSPSPAEEWARKPRSIPALFESQSEILDLISSRAPLQETLGRTASLAEEVLSAAYCCVLVLDGGAERFVETAAPTLPAPILEVVRGGQVADKTSAEAICAASGTTLYLPDLADDSGELPSDFTKQLFSCGIKAVWAYPLLEPAGMPVGVLSLYFGTKQGADPQTDSVLRSLARLARFAVEHHRSDEALQSADQRFGALAASIPGVVYQRKVSPDGEIRYTYISDGAKDLFGVSPEEIVSDPNALFDCHSPEYRETFRERLLEASRDLTMWDVEATIDTKDGQRKYTHAIARPHRMPDGTVYWDGVILDSTRIKEAELRAASIEARTREEILESVSQGLALYDENDSLVVCNSHFLELSPGLGDVIRPGVSYERVARAIIENSLPGRGDAADADELLRQQMELHRAGGHSSERRLPNGRWVLVTEHRTDHGGTAIVLTDVTELKKREATLERSNQELQQFASVASHDLQEPLRKIEAFGNRLHSLCAEKIGDEATLYLDRMLSSTRRMRKLINDLLAYSRVTTKSRPFEPCDFKLVATEVVSDLQIQIEESDGLVQIGELPVIDADAMQIRQLLQNLISNALKFRRPDAPPEVRVSGRLVTAADRIGETMPPPGDVLELSVSDNGIGFDMKYVDRIFNIFQRLHNRSEYDGTGIGLATCRKIVERHGGELRAVSEPGHGTTITAVLPVKQIFSEA